MRNAHRVSPFCWRQVGLSSGHQPAIVPACIRDDRLRPPEKARTRKSPGLAREQQSLLSKRVEVESRATGRTIAFHRRTDAKGRRREEMLCRQHGDGASRSQVRLEWPADPENRGSPGLFCLGTSVAARRHCRTSRRSAGSIASTLTAVQQHSESVNWWRSMIERGRSTSCS